MLSSVTGRSFRCITLSSPSSAVSSIRTFGEVCQHVASSTRNRLLGGRSGVHVFFHGDVARKASNQWRPRRNNPSGRRHYKQKPSAEFVPEKSDALVAGIFVERKLSELWKPALFAVGFCGGCYVGATIWRYENERRRLDYLFKFHYTREKFGEFRKGMHDAWSSLDGGHKTIGAIIAVNALVTMAWRFQRLQRPMLTWFTNSFFRKHNSITMLTSTFSHHSLIHLGLNMYVLSQFGPTVLQDMMGLEQFCGFYLAAGLSFYSFIYPLAEEGTNTLLLVNLTV